MGAFVNYQTAEGEVIQVKTGISFVSIEQARLNLDTEMNRFGWDFGAVRKNARETWNDLLGKIEVEGGSESDRTKFYTNFTAPLWHDDLQRRERQSIWTQTAWSANSKNPNLRCWGAMLSGTPSGT